MSDRIVIAGGARTPFGRLTGALSNFSAADLGGFAISAALKRSNITPDLVDYVYMGHVIGAGAGQMPARRAAFNAGIGLDVPSISINKACLSGLNAIYLAWQMIKCGDAEIVVAGGMESMTNAPYVLAGLRSGWKLGDRPAIDTVNQDALFCAIDHELMGAATDSYTRAISTLTRAEQDRVAYISHMRAADATAKGRFDDEIVPVSVPRRKGDDLIVDSDEGIRSDTSVETLAKLRPVFAQDGVVTAGNASQISDGACATVIMRASKAEELGVEPLCELVSFGQVAGPTTSLLPQPANAVNKALANSDGLGVDDMALFELNEAFASVSLHSTQLLGVSEDKVNVNGGAIALGHPVGATGTRIALSLALELRRRGGGYGAAGLCGGGGQGDALVISVG